MNLRNIEFLIQEAFTGIRRNGVMAFATISTIALSIGVLGTFVLAVMSVNKFAANQINKFQIAVFMQNEADLDATESVADSIRRMKGVKSVTIRDRDREWARLKRDNPNIETAGLPMNPLPYALDVQVDDQKRTALIAAKIRALDKVGMVNAGSEYLDRLMAVTHVIKVLSTIGVVALVITTALIISNAIRLTLYARRREIRIMQLVGATNWFIRIPLILEGIVFGVAGAMIALVLLKLGSTYLGAYAVRTLPLLGQFKSGVQTGDLAIYLAILGAMIGAVGSFISIRRFLHDS